MIERTLKDLVGQEVTLFYVVADSGIIISKTILKGELKGRTCKKNYNDFDLFAVASPDKKSIAYIDPRRWVGNPNYMVTIENNTIRVTFNSR